MIVENLYYVLADSETKALVYIFVLGPIIIMALFLLACVIMGIMTLFGYMVTNKYKVKPGDSPKEAARKESAYNASIYSPD